jgi:hypothetical protein
MNKRHLIGYPVAVILALTIGAAGAAGSSTATDAAAPAPTVTVTGPAPETVTQAPAECGTALDFASEFATDVAAEHSAMGDAFTQAGQDGDLITAMNKSGDAAKALTDQMAVMASPMTAAAQVCRAAIK